MDDLQQRQLAESGYVLFPALIDPSQVVALRSRLEELWAAEGLEAGVENYIEPGVRRLANLANKGEIFRGIYARAEVLEAVQDIMGSEVRASMVNARDVPPHAGARMPFHMDSDGGRQRDEVGFNAATAIWMLDDFTVENGATAIIPGSHSFGRNPKQVLADLNAPHPEEVIITGAAGDVLVFNGHCWHAGRPNLTGVPRRALLVHYLRADVPRPASRRQHLDPEMAARLSPGERELLGLDDP
ncbi:MAG TPA: phytanoyl-CoA dioxygenase family protein [Anaerolineales bacterium]|nr:phytanoyl-CoA dioxygenase family protein [Anaerolineales bacterium]